MDEARIEGAMNRIEAALARIEQAAVARTGSEVSGTAHLEVEQKVGAVLSDLDALIAELER